MKFRLIFLVVAVSLATEFVNAENDLDLGAILRLGIRFILLNLKRMGTISLEDVSFTIPEEVKNISQFVAPTKAIVLRMTENKSRALNNLQITVSTGTMDLKSAQIYGFETLYIENLETRSLTTADNGSKTNLCVNLLLDQLGFSSNYDADIGIVNQIPIYGDGKLGLAISNIDFGLCVNININQNFSEFYIDDLELSLEMHDSPSYITRFWKNDTVSELVTAVMNILEKLLCMWLSYEKGCVSCVISPILQNIINSILPNTIDSNLDLNCTCLQNSFSGENYSGYTLQTLIEAYQEGRVANVLNVISNEQLLYAIEGIEGKLLDMLRKEGLTIEL